MSIKVISNLEISNPINASNPTTKQYVDNLIDSNKQTFTTLTLTTDVLDLAEETDKDGWLIIINNGVTPNIIKLPNISNYTSTEIVTYEMLIRCLGNENDSISIVFKDYSNNIVEFMGENTNNLNRDYTYFFVFRNFPYSTQTVNGTTTVLRQWVGNIQGRVRIPT
jgi:hypothetical protein